MGESVRASACAQGGAPAGSPRTQSVRIMALRLCIMALCGLCASPPVDQGPTTTRTSETAWGMCEDKKNFRSLSGGGRCALLECARQSSSDAAMVTCVRGDGKGRAAARAHRGLSLDGEWGERESSQARVPVMRDDIDSWSRPRLAESCRATSAVVILFFECMPARTLRRPLPLCRGACRFPPLLQRRHSSGAAAARVGFRGAIAAGSAVAAAIAGGGFVSRFAIWSPTDVTAGVLRQSASGCC